MINFINKHILSILIITTYFSFSANIGGTSIYMYDEVKNAQCAREMMESGNYIVPTFNHGLRTDKPPLHYYCMMVAYQIFGFGPFAARFFSAVFGVLMVMVTYLFVKEFLGKNVAIITCFTMVSSIQVATQFHLATPDPYLIAFLTTALLSFYKGFYREDRNWHYLAYLAIALATLAKGPVAILLPGLIVVLFLISEKKFTLNKILSLRPIEGILIILLVAGPWYLLVHIETNGAWSEGFFLKHNLQRYSREMEGHGAPFYMPLVYVITGLLPLGLFLPRSLYSSFKLRNENSFINFSLIVVAVYIGFFAFSKTILPSYPGPCLPFAAALIANFLYYQQRKFFKGKWYLNVEVWLISLIGIGLPLAAYFGLKTEGYLKDVAFISGYLWPFPIFSIIALFYLKKKKVSISLMLALSGFWMGTIYIHFFAYPKIDEKNPVFLLNQISNKTSQVIAYKQMNPAFLIPLGAPVLQVENLEGLSRYLENKEEVFIISRKKYMDELNSLKKLEFISSMKELFEKPTAVLFRYQRNNLQTVSAFK